MVLEEFTVRDIPILLKWLNGTNSRFLYQFAGPKYKFPLNEEQLLQTIESNAYLSFKVIKTESNEVIGHCQFMRIDTIKSTASIGRLLINPLYRGKGYGTQMLMEMINYALRELKLTKLELRVFDFNKSAIKCYKNIGFREQKVESFYIVEFDEEWKCISLDYNIKLLYT